MGIASIEITRVRFEFRDDPKEQSGTYPRAKRLKMPTQIIEAAGEEVKELSAKALRLLEGQ